MKSLEIGELICSKLSENEDLAKLIDGKIFPLIADNGTTYPFIVYRRSSVETSNTKDLGDIEEDAQVEIAVATQTYDSSLEIVKLVHDTLNGKKFKYNDSIVEINATNASEEYNDEGGAFVQKLMININLE